MSNSEDTAGSHTNDAPLKGVYEAEAARHFGKFGHDNVAHLPPVAPEGVTCDMFMRALTRFTTRGLICMAYPVSIAGAKGSREVWPAYEWKPGVQHPSPSPYFNISTIKRPPVPGVDFDPADGVGNAVPSPKISRGIADCVETFVILLDDISSNISKGGGGKVKPENIPMAPTYRIETSPGNFQYGYLLAQPADPMDAAALIDALREAKNSDGTQKYTDKNGVAGVNRLVRVPGSRNDKPGRNGWKAIVREWEPNRVFTLAELSTGFGVTPISASMPRHVQAADTDIVLQSLEKLGVVLNSHPNSRGFYDITCPWASAHGEDPRTEAGYKPSNERGVFHCHHTGCAGRHYGNLCEHLEAQDTEFAGKMLAKLTAEKVERSQAVKDVFAANPLSDDGGANDSYLPPSKTEAEAVERRKANELAATPPTAWEVFDHSKTRRPIPKRRALMSFLQRGAVTQLFSPSNLGKSQFALAVTYALAFERHDIVGEDKPFQLPGGTFYVCNEDDYLEFERRSDVLLQVHGLDYSAMKHAVRVNKAPSLKVVRRVDKYSAPEITPEMTRLGEDIKAARGAALVVVDTQASSFQGLSENDSDDMAEAFRLLDEWAKSLDVALMLVHHTTKSAAQSGAVGHENSRGSGAAGASTRYTVQLVGLAEKETAKLPAAERHAWFAAVLTKTAYGAKDGSRRWFRKVGKAIPTEDFDGNIASMDNRDTASACVYDRKGPGVTVDTDNATVLDNALLAICEADRAGKPLLSSTTGPRDRRGDAVLGVLVSGNDGDGRLLLGTLAHRGLIEEGEHPDAKGRPKRVWRATKAGALAAEERAKNALLDAPGDGGQRPVSEVNGRTEAGDASPETPDEELSRSFPMTGKNQGVESASVSSGRAFPQSRALGIVWENDPTFPNSQTPKPIGVGGLGDGAEDLREQGLPDLTPAGPPLEPAPAPAVLRAKPPAKIKTLGKAKPPHAVDIYTDAWPREFLGVAPD